MLIILIHAVITRTSKYQDSTAVFVDVDDDSVSFVIAGEFIWLYFAVLFINHTNTKVPLAEPDRYMSDDLVGFDRGDSEDFIWNNL